MRELLLINKKILPNMVESKVQETSEFDEKAGWPAGDNAQHVNHQVYDAANIDQQEYEFNCMLISASAAIAEQLA